MKKIILLFFCVLYMQTAQAQLKGLYVSKDKPTTTSIEFFDNQKFIYTSIGPCYYTKGQGTYNLQDDKLILLFKVDSVKTKIEKLAPIANQTHVTIYISTKDNLSKEILSGAAAYINTTGQVTNEEGTCSLSMPISNEQSILHIALVGYTLLAIPITPNTDQRIEALLMEDKGIKDGQKWVYKIAKRTQKSMKLEILDEEERKYEDSEPMLFKKVAKR